MQERVFMYISPLRFLLKVRNYVAGQRFRLANLHRLQTFAASLLRSATPTSFPSREPGNYLQRRTNGKRKRLRNDRDEAVVALCSMERMESVEARYHEN